MDIVVNDVITIIVKIIKVVVERLQKKKKKCCLVEIVVPVEGIVVAEVAEFASNEVVLAFIPWRCSSIVINFCS